MSNFKTVEELIANPTEGFKYLYENYLIKEFRQYVDAHPKKDELMIALKAARNTEEIAEFQRQKNLEFKIWEKTLEGRLKGFKYKLESRWRFAQIVLKNNKRTWWNKVIRVIQIMLGK